MSNYSDFFGVGSSGGGGSFPVNSYLSYFVTSTGNPTGYDATTGLYSHPNGEFWLETGNIIGASPYPNATKVLDPIPTGNTATIGITVTAQAPVSKNLIVTDGTNYYANDVATGGYRVRQLDSSFASTGYSITFSPPGFAGNNREGYFSYFGSAPVFGTINQSNWQKVVPPATTWTTEFTGPNGFNASATTNTAGTTIFIAPNSSTVTEYSWPGGVATGNTFSATGAVLGMVAIAPYIIACTSTTIELFDDTSFAAVGSGPITTGNGSNILPNFSDSSRFYLGSAGNNFNSLVEYEIGSVGDGTAKTDPDTSQPFFVRIG